MSDLDAGSDTEDEDQIDTRVTQSPATSKNGLRRVYYPPHLCFTLS